LTGDKHSYKVQSNIVHSLITNYLIASRLLHFHPLPLNPHHTSALRHCSRSDRATAETADNAVE